MLTKLNSLLITTSKDPLGLDPLPPETNLSKLLRFPLGKDSALLPLEQIVEVIRVNIAEILPIPEMPSCILGISNWRGEMLWLVDLNHLVGYPPLTAALTQIAVVVQVNQQAVGLVVQRVDDIEAHDMQQLQKAAIGTCGSSILPFALGTLPGDNLVLNVTAIIQSPLWQIHSSS